MLAEKTTSVSSQKKLKPLLSYMYERAGIHDFSAGICAVSGDYCIYRLIGGLQIMHLVAGNGAWELADFQPPLSILIPVTLLTLSPRQQRQELLLRSRMKTTSKMGGPPWTKTERTRSAQKTRTDPLTENDRIRSTSEIRTRLFWNS
ncbi:unnamed protein product [Sphagnum jensenii]|uniref:Uncharacterized protein n=1 Tax=Sphagnum jensenii TaxID=128206 RepID=A0ABP0XI33_9BRYO